MAGDVPGRHLAGVPVGPDRGILMPLVRRAQRIIRRLRPELWLVEGSEATSEQPLSVLCASVGTYLLDLAFGDSYRKHHVGKTWLWNLPRAVREKGQGCALALIGVRDPYLRLVNLTNSFVIPAWVRGEVDLPLGSALLNTSSVKSDVRRIRKSRLQFSVTRDPRHFHEFYHRMYVPYITEAHGRSAFIWPYDAMKGEFENCELLLVKKEGRPIAGILITYDRPTPRLWSLGVRDADRRHVQEGAVTALFYFSFMHLEKSGYRLANVGLTRPFLDDGVLRYKKKWGVRIVGTSTDWLVLKLLTATPGARGFMRSHPFMFRSGGDLSGAIFVDSARTYSPEELERLKLRHSIPGLAKLRLYRLRDTRAVEMDAL
jgi:hypothetical protein